MGFKLANVDGNAALIKSESYYELSRYLKGALSTDPSAVNKFIGCSVKAIHSDSMILNPQDQSRIETWEHR